MPMKPRVSTLTVQPEEQIMTNCNQVRVTPRDQQVLNLLAKGCSNKEIGGELNISPGTVKQHLRMLCRRTGILDGRKRVKLARYFYEGEGAVVMPCDGLNPRESQDFGSGLGRPDESRNCHNEPFL